MTDVTYLAAWLSAIDAPAAEALAARLRDLNPLVRVELTEPWPFTTCDWCGYLEAPGVCRVSWWPSVGTRGERVGSICTGCVEGAVSGFVLPQVCDHDGTTIDVEIGAAA